MPKRQGIQCLGENNHINMTEVWRKPRGLHIDREEAAGAPAFILRKGFRSFLIPT